MTMSLDDRTNAALTSIGSQLEGTAAGTLGLLLALCLAGLAGQLTFDAVADAIGQIEAKRRNAVAAPPRSRSRSQERCG